MFSAVLMLVDLVSWFCEPQHQARLWELPKPFSKVRFAFEKVCWGIFFEPKAKRSIAARGRKDGERKSREPARRVEDLNGRGPARSTRRGRAPF